MRYIFLLVSVCLALLLHAQSSWSDKPFLVQTSLKQTIAYHIPYQETLIQLAQDKSVAYQLIAIDNSTLSVRSQIKNIKGKIIAFGQEQVFDANQKDSLTEVERVLVDSLLLPQVQTISLNGTAKYNQAISLSIEPEDLRKFFLADRYRKATTAFTWKDSTVVDSSTSIYECTFLRDKADTIQIHVFATHEIKNTIKQGDQVISQVLKGLEQSMRYYNSKTGILMKEQRLIQFEGTAESQNTRFPVSVKLESIVNSQ